VKKAIALHDKPFPVEFDSSPSIDFSQLPNMPSGFDRVQFPERGRSIRLRQARGLKVPKRACPGYAA
jgi:hypothetical protein